MSGEKRIEKTNQVTSICVAPSQWEAVRRLAFATGTTKSEIIRTALAQYLAKVARTEKS